MNIEIKHFDDLSTKDLYEILYLRCKVFVVEQACTYQDCDGKDTDAYHLMLKEDKLAGYLRILRPGVSYEEVAIGRVVVDEDYRHLKFGKKIMNEAISFILSQGYDAIRISAQLYLKDFYQSLGFEVVSDMYLEDDIEHIEMLYKKS
ncbi:GNAT family N-acetyltransferase [Acidaminobacter sp. JC074]|uniref:GNAT family N-acetyltransferase n=1 Tax=Acidaminobacter sp. JC074 TaxID=2530199 RepID=UPI001F0D90F7|nr:GNAT family N-acetyltransferase [Acidaminobacter sp. JC074]MCH4887620.1 GNAT family N-acetyltransferase [Acidaminobacter sp. JC074]